MELKGEKTRILIAVEYLYRKLVMADILSILDTKEYASFYKTYLKELHNEEIVSLMISDLEDQLAFLENIPEDRFSYRYEKNKWSIAELISHCGDSEAVMAYRALTFSRSDKTSLAGFEQNDWVPNSNANKLSKDQLIGYFKTTRNHSIALYKTFNKEQLMEIGIANDSPFSVRALGYIIIGHNRHHFKILKNRYLI